jgi:hypothetical protein
LVCRCGDNILTYRGRHGRHQTCLPTGTVSAKLSGQYQLNSYDVGVRARLTYVIRSVDEDYFSDAEGL